MSWVFPRYIKATWVYDIHDFERLVILGKSYIALFFGYPKGLNPILALAAPGGRAYFFQMAWFNQAPNAVMFSMIHDPWHKINPVDFGSCWLFNEGVKDGSKYP